MSATTTPVNAQGTPITGITNDFDNDTSINPSTPDIGAERSNRRNNSNANSDGNSEPNGLTNCFSDSHRELLTATK